MYEKDVGTAREVFHGRAKRTEDGHVQTDFCQSESGRITLKNVKPKKPLPERLVQYNEIKREVLGVKKGDPFDKFIVKKGSPEHEEIMRKLQKK